MIAIFNSRSAKCARWACAPFPALLAALACFAFAQTAFAAEASAGTNETTFARAERLLAEAKSAWAANPKDPELAWKYARACFDAGEYAPNDTLRAQFAEKGIDGARAALALKPNHAPSLYYLAMNLGQLARTKRLSALRLVSEMESSCLSVVRLDPNFDFAGAHRYLGLLYRDAPGWPISVGDRSKARKHLSKAVEVAPDYPNNWLNLVEAHIGWGEREKARAQFKAAEPHLKAARERFTGVEWAPLWESWNQRLEAIRSKLQLEKIESPKSQ